VFKAALQLACGAVPFGGGGFGGGMGEVATGKFRQLGRDTVAHAGLGLLRIDRLLPLAQQFREELMDGPGLAVEGGSGLRIVGKGKTGRGELAAGIAQAGLAPALAPVARLMVGGLVLGGGTALLQPAAELDKGVPQVIVLPRTRSALGV